MGLKIHCKLSMLVRRDQDRLQRQSRQRQPQSRRPSGRPVDTPEGDQQDHGPTPHEAFAVAHTVNKTSEDVWVLDQFCHADSFHEARKPLVLNGPPGSGKSTLLASWAQRRKALP